MKWLLYVSLLYISIHSGLAADTNNEKVIVLTEDTEQLLIGRYLAYFKDPTVSYTIEKVHSKETDAQFIAVNEDVPNFGPSRSEYWFRFKINNQTDSKTWILEFDHPGVVYSNLYQLKDDTANEFIKISPGSLNPKGHKSTHRNQLFYVDLPQGKEQTLYLNTRTFGGLPVSIRIFTQERFLQYSYHEQIAFGMYFGVMFVMASYNLFVFFSLRDVSFLYYVMYTISVVFLQIGILGYGKMFIWEKNCWIDLNFFPVFNISIIISLSLFTKKFLNTKEIIPLLDKVFNIIIGLQPLNFLLIFLLPYDKEITLNLCLTIPFAVLVFLAPLIAMQRGYTPARYFSISFTAILVAGICNALMYGNVLPSNFFTENGLYIGSTIEVILLSFALVDKINILKREKETAQEQTVEMQTLLADSYKAMNASLEKTVEQRTKDLNETLKQIRADLSMAKKLQQKTLPKLNLEGKNLSILTHYLPMSEIGGDFYDIHELEPGYFRIFLVDATGHGVQAALSTMTIKAEYEGIKNIRTKPAHLMEILNNECFMKYKSMNLLFSAIIADIDLNNKNLSFASAGHPPQIFKNSSNTDILNASGSIIGLKKDANYQAVDLQIETGNRIFLFSDGIYEEFDEHKIEFGADRVFSLLSLDSEMGHVVDKLLLEIESHVGPSGQQDDITLLSIEVL
ncbi:7TM diverse intracellular signaling domain-containing protein [Leptospira sp. 'Mane']|uniref:7TM diverse intracellular signaling domain-containing protein n=1 Tax=Leptospira sp. 'Mane' TaxID=3387407 RepID=UPI00398AEEB9